ncbi:MAG: isoleucine--tRNA ligase [Oligoflexia bacterium]|nr:isoleucine--tRNA ligase [Oligoflexia bacterium]MBF0365113.1 isoleucine--tRNA ligase [Oligoflexia bacterium]
MENKQSELKQTKPQEKHEEFHLEEKESISFPEMEQEILAFWDEKKIFEKSLEASRNRPPYIFYDGPPFATGLPHHGHLVSSTLKDIVPRYFTMKGYYVHRRFGWDCHGLPIEQEIDKKFNMSAQEFVKKNGIAAYNDECRSIVLRFTKEWEKTIRRLGRWVDFINNYKTMDLSFMESVWWVFKELWNQGLVYRGEKVVPFSTAFGTVLSNFEANQNYQEVQDPAITILFRLKGPKAFDSGLPVYLSAWTTTPWTLPSNLSLCVHQDIEYVKVKDKDKNIIFYLAKDRFEGHYGKKYKLEVLESIRGKELEGQEYEPLFPFFEKLASEGAFKVMLDDYVTTSDGTGIVHQAPAFGEDDYRVMKRYGFKSIVCPVDDHGKFTAEVSEWASMYVKDADKLIIRKLKEEGKLYEQSTLVHSYPFCYRTDTPLIYRAISSWYVDVEKIKENLINANQEIHWVPDHIKNGRFGKWLEGARDWSISRNRIWGTPIPIWLNEKNGKYLCIGSIEELASLSGTKVSDLHREHVDKISFRIPGEDGDYHRIPEVLDCWFESGSMPYAQLHYPFENYELFHKTFPAEYIAEGLDQTRGWFYTLTVLSAALFKRPAFKNVIVNGLVLANDGKKMSKRLKNYTPPDELMESFGADALRLFLINSGLVRGEELRFSDEGVKDMVRRALLPWFNSFKFFKTYAEIDQWNPSEHLHFGENILDQWIISRLQTLIISVSKEMDAYHLYNVVPALFIFIEELTNWYIRLNRRRFWDEGLSNDKKSAYSTLYTALKTLSTLMAPFTPFLSEHIYLELKKLGGATKESVHLESYPTPKMQLINQNLEEAAERMMQIILLGRQRRNQVQIKVKTPLRKLLIIHKDELALNEIRCKLAPYIQGELNIKSIEYSLEEERFIRLYAKPNAPLLGKRFGKEFARFRALIEKLGSKEVAMLEAGGEILLEGEKFNASDILVYREPIGNDVEIISNRFITMKLDSKLDQELIDEGTAREIVNRIQRMRKEMNFHVSDRIEISAQGDSELVNVIKKHEEYIKQETLTGVVHYIDSVIPEGSAGVFHFSHEKDEKRGVTILVKR